MGKSKKKKTGQQNPQGGFKKFVSDLLETLALLKLNYNLFDLSPRQLRFCYKSSFRLKNPMRGNDFISSADVRWVGSIFKYYFRNTYTEVGGCKLTFYQASVFLSLCLGTHIYKSKKYGKNDPYVKLLDEISFLLLKQIVDDFSRACYMGLLMSNDPVRKYYSMKQGINVIRGKVPRMELEIKLCAYPVLEMSYRINGHRRLAYRLGHTKMEGMDWVNVSAKKLKKHYSGKKKELPVFIQSHAIIRMVHRLDLFNNIYLTLQFYLNLNPISKFVFYRGYILIPFVIKRIKVGYFMASVVKDVLLIRTFLFITHSSTPEGDKLKALTGMGKQDLSYWRIDRISTFYSMKGSDIEGLREIFKEAGVEKLLRIKDINLDGLNSSPNPNLDGLVHFLEMAKENHEDERQQWEAFLGESLGSVDVLEIKEPERSEK
ncbi:hypothetical protein ACT29H_08815 [Thermophagus sp. OGC60D27]|uniref:hypothetical protein n=1 Tax=Thermophagus sp. OGC60D27 TaxID=3458415 RepID=UPI00403793D4